LLCKFGSLGRRSSILRDELLGSDSTSSIPAVGKFMFTGIVSHIGKVEGIEGAKFTFSVPASFIKSLKKGSSISVNGVCLTLKNSPSGRKFNVDLMPETQKRTSFSDLKKGDSVNLEPAMKTDSRFEGHIVQGHIDGTAKLGSVKKQGNSYIMTFAVPKPLTRYIAEKGSIAVNGISLTVISARGNQFTVGIIPYTWENTMLKRLKAGDKVNIEVDILAKYLEKLVKNVKKTH